MTKLSHYEVIEQLLALAKSLRENSGYDDDAAILENIVANLDSEDWYD